MTEAFEALFFPFTIFVDNSFAEMIYVGILRRESVIWRVMAANQTAPKCPPCAAAETRDTRIKHIIVLMLENRSFDHLLGYADINGIDGVQHKNLSNKYNGQEYFVRDDAKTVLDLKDPGHDFADVQQQVYWSDGTKANGPDPAMQGFVASYARYSDEPWNILKCYRPKDLPVITKLAERYAVCNRWFSSIPGPTLPNRLYAHAGTSDKRLDLSAEEIGTSRTIYEVLADADVSSTIYADGWTTTATFARLMKYQDQFFGTLDDFYQDCYDNNLPAYCFLEPRYSSGVVNGIFLPQNDQHPDSDVNEGEHLIFSVYQAIRSNRKIWESSMLVIVYDEHGGIYDHVPPPAATPPGDGDSPDPKFKFDRYGVRVPAVIVSAYTDHVVCNDVFDHTSLIATARKLLTKGEFRDDQLKNRAKSANTFDVVLNCKDPQKDHVEIPLVPLKKKTRGSEHLNHLQIAHLKQAFVLNGNLPASLQIQQPAQFEGLDTKSNDEAFKGKNIDPVDAEHYIRTVLAKARYMNGKVGAGTK